VLKALTAPDTSPQENVSMNQKKILSRGIAATLLCAVAPLTFAAPIDSGVLNINVPVTLAGVYLNMVTGATGSNAAATAGWDFNPYSASTTTGLTFFAPASGGGSYVLTGGSVSELAPGTVISASSTFGGTGVVTTNPAIRTPGDKYVGLRLFNEATGAINYGYGLLRIGSGGTAPGFPATIIRYGFCNAGESATIPATPGAPICGGGGGGGGTSDIALFINNDAGYTVATGAAKTGGTTVNVGQTYSFFARVLNNLSGAVTGGALAVTVPTTSRYDSATCSGSVVPTIPAGPIAAPGPVNVTGINFTGRTNPPLVGGVVPLTCRFNFTAVAAGSGTHTGTVSQTSTGNVAANDSDTFAITANAVQAPAIPVNSLNAWGIAALAFLLGLVGFAVVRRRA
jgi:hypothetical protein